MVVRLRLAMHGRKHARIFHLVAIRDQKARNAKPIELLGIYDPAMTLGEKYKTVEWSVDRIKYWLGVGAMPSKPVVRLLETGGVIPPDSKYHPKALGPRVLPPIVPLDAMKANTFWQRLSDQITDSTTDGLKVNKRGEPLPEETTAATQATEHSKASPPEASR
ncbi:hypothetical protein HWV62_6409 [Athelia sp. TMB]|nr:hypothetical protein HWV62_6409 [Athelia sp. TMB]